jgi:hypothetical protein
MCPNREPSITPYTRLFIAFPFSEPNTVQGIFITGTSLALSFYGIFFDPTPIKYDGGTPLRTAAERLSLVFVMNIFTVSSSSLLTGELLQLWHGTDIASANWIATNGLSLEGLLQIPGAFAFCATTEQKVASVYADINPLRGAPAVLGFQLPLITLQGFLSREPPWAEEIIEDRGYHFFPATFTTMNLAMTNFSVQKVTEFDLRFDE